MLDVVGGSVVDGAAVVEPIVLTGSTSSSVAVVAGPTGTVTITPVGSGVVEGDAADGAPSPHPTVRDRSDEDQHPICHTTSTSEPDPKFPHTTTIRTVERSRPAADADAPFRALQQPPSCRSRALMPPVSVRARSRAIAAWASALQCSVSEPGCRQKISQFGLVLSSDQQGATPESGESASLRVFVPNEFYP